MIDGEMGWCGGSIWCQPTARVNKRGKQEHGGWPDCGRAWVDRVLGLDSGRCTCSSARSSLRGWSLHDSSGGGGGGKMLGRIYMEKRPGPARARKSVHMTTELGGTLSPQRRTAERRPR